MIRLLRHSMCGALLPVVLLLAEPGACAEDFSGFYAGINAGYVRGQGRDVTVGVPVTGSATDRGRPGLDLPPSAADAALALRPAGRRSGLSGPR